MLKALTASDPVIERMIALYEERRAAPTPHARVMWDDPHKQLRRFCELLEFVDITSEGGVSILDVGCGNGELYRHLSACGFCGTYRGVDINRMLLDEAKSRFPQAEFGHADEDSSGPYDYVLMSGVFNANAGQTEQWVHRILERWFAPCTKALIFNAISGYVTRREDHMFYLPLSDTIDFVAQRLSPVFEIRHGFLPFNYTVCVRKQAGWRSLGQMPEENSNS